MGQTGRRVRIKHSSNRPFNVTGQNRSAIRHLRRNTMALKIRLARGGSKKRPIYRVVVADSRLPKDSENRVQIDAEKAVEWIKKGAKPTDRVARFLSLIEVDGAPIYKWEHGNNPNKGEP